MRNRSFVIWPETDGQATVFFRRLAHTRAEKLAASRFRFLRAEIECQRQRLTLAGDIRDVLAARDSLKQLLGINPLDA